MRSIILTFFVFSIAACGGGGGGAPATSPTLPPFAGDYSGYAVLGDAGTGRNNIVLVSISNDQRALLLPLER